MENYDYRDENSKKIKRLINLSFQAILDSTKDMMFVKDADLVYVAASMPFVRMVGKNHVEEVVGHTDTEIFADENLAKKYIADDKKLFSTEVNLEDYIEPLTEENGHARYGSTSKYILKDEDGKILGVLGITKDITREYMARQHYQQELKYLFKLPANTYAVSYIDIDSWRIISQRRQLIYDGTLQACNSIEELCHAAVESIVDRNSEVSEFYSNFHPEKLKSIYNSGRSNLSFKYERKMSDGKKHWVHNEIRFIIDADCGHLCAMLSAKDIDAEKREEEKLVVDAKMDKMTMVYNRSATIDNIKKILRDEPDGLHALFMIDVDNFKALNDNFGHQAGDEFLVEMAGRLKKEFEECGVVGRIGGDEFFVLMRNAGSIDAVSKKAKEVLSSIQVLCGRYPVIRISASIGISLYPKHGETVDELYGQADGALYQAKREGKNQFIIAKI